MRSREQRVTIPPDVVRMRASSTVFVKASSLVNRDLGGMVISKESAVEWKVCCSPQAGGFEVGVSADQKLMESTVDDKAARLGVLRRREAVESESIDMCGLMLLVLSQDARCT